MCDLAGQLTFAEFSGGISDEYIRESICIGTGFSGGKQRVKDFFKKEPDRKLRADFLKDEYGIGGYAFCDDEGIHHHQNHDSRGLEICRNDEKVILKWDKVADLIAGMIQEGVYG